jgi:hypothetical protein
MAAVFAGSVLQEGERRMVKLLSRWGPASRRTVGRPAVRGLVGMFTALLLVAVAVGVTGSPAYAKAHHVTEIQNDGNGKCLDVATQNNYIVQLWNCTNAPEQNWIYGEPTIIGGVQYIQLINWRNDTCLDVAGGSLDAWVPVVVNPCVAADSHPAADSQLWAPMYAGSPTISTLVNRHSGLCLDLYLNNSRNGTPIQQYPCNGTSAQVWRINDSWL